MNSIFDIMSVKRVYSYHPSENSYDWSECFSTLCQLADLDIELC